MDRLVKVVTITTSSGCLRLSDPLSAPRKIRSTLVLSAMCQPVTGKVIEKLTGSRFPQSLFLCPVQPWLRRVLDDS